MMIIITSPWKYFIGSAALIGLGFLFGAYVGAVVGVGVTTHGETT